MVEPGESTEHQLTEAITRLTDVAERLSTSATPAGGVALAGTEALSQRTRFAQNGKVFGAFLVGVLVTAMLVPQLVDDDETTVATGSVGTEQVGGDAPVAAGEGTAPAEGAAPTDTVAPAAGAPAVAAGGTAGGGAPAPAGGAKATAPAGAAAVARGQSGPGVTDKVITIGMVDLDSSDLAPVCPRCGNGPSANGAAAEGLLAAWRRDGMLPVHGRDIKLVRRQTKVLDTGQRRAACTELVQQVKPFATIVNPVGSFDVAECLAKEFKQQTIAIDAPDEKLLGQAPTLYAPAGTLERTLRNYAHWGHRMGIWKDQVIGLYYHPNGANINGELLSRSLKPELTKLGYKVAVEVQADGDPGTAAQPSTPLAVQRFRTGGVTTAIVLVDTLSFQQQAKAQGYKPKYPQADAGYTFVDAVADITFDPDQMDGNLGMRVKYWDWASRRPAVPKGNDSTTYCLKAYTDFAKRTLDVFDNGAEIQYVVESCTSMEVLLKALQNAGPNLSPQSFTQGMTSIRGLRTSELLSVTFAPTRRAGADMQGTYQFKKSRFQPTNEYFGLVAPGWQRYFVE